MNFTQAIDGKIMLRSTSSLLNLKLLTLGLILNYNLNTGFLDAAEEEITPNNQITALAAEEMIRELSRETIKTYQTAEEWIAAEEAAAANRQPFFRVGEMRFFPFSGQFKIDNQKLDLNIPYLPAKKEPAHPHKAINYLPVDIFFPVTEFQKGGTCAVHSLNNACAIDQGYTATTEDYMVIKDLLTKYFKLYNASADKSEENCKGIYVWNIKKAIKQMGFQEKNKTLTFPVTGNYSSIFTKDKQLLYLCDSRFFMRTPIKSLKKYMAACGHPNELTVILLAPGHAMAIKAIYTNQRLKVYVFDSGWLFALGILDEPKALRIQLNSLFGIRSLIKKILIPALVYKDRPSTPTGEGSFKAAIFKIYRKMFPKKPSN